MANMFGHHFISGPHVHIDCWGSGPLLIRHGQRQWWFEFSDIFGPTLLRASDKEPAVRQPTEESDPFWPPFTAWLKGGQKVRAVRKRVRGKPGPVAYHVCHVPRGRMLG
jgi:hypothetical protein